MHHMGFPWLAPEGTQAPHPQKQDDMAGQVSDGEPDMSVDV